MIDCFQCVVLNDCQSSFSILIHDIPQESALGPLLFLFCINDLTDVLNNYNFTLFVENITILFYDKNANIIIYNNNNTVTFVCINCYIYIYI